MTKPALEPLPIRLLAGVKPPLKYCGGKAWLVPHLAPGIAEYLNNTDGTYYEPFLGAGAMALALGRDKMVLSDACEPLIEFYNRIAFRDPFEVYTMLVQLVRDYGCERWGYDKLRERFNADGFGPITRAAAFLYLNRRCYNGLFRVNSKGKFNVPCGRYKIDPENPMKFFADREHLQAVHDALSGPDVEILPGHFRDRINAMAPGDVGFFDPPYEGPGSFVAYVKAGFTGDDHAELAQLSHEAAGRGAAVFVTVSEHSRDRYEGPAFTILSTLERRAINSDGEGRKAAPCIIAVSRGHEHLARPV